MWFAVTYYSACGFPHNGEALVIFEEGLWISFLRAL